jgi:hypothetical protein
MIPIRHLAALLLLSLASAVMAQPGPGTLVARDSFTLTQVPTGTATVQVFLEDDPDPDPWKMWKVSAGSAEQAAKRTWKVDARCAMRLKSLTAKQADGKIHDFKPGIGVKNLQKEVSLTTFAPPVFKQLCLDIANGTTISANQGLIPLSELKKRQTKFQEQLTAEPWWVTGEVLLSGRCTTPDGASTVTNVVDKKFPAQIEVQCCVNCF